MAGLFKTLIQSGEWDNKYKNEIRCAIQGQQGPGWLVYLGQLGQKNLKKKILSVGKPSDHFQPMKGRDRVRTADGDLVLYTHDSQLLPSYNEAWYKRDTGTTKSSTRSIRVSTRETLTGYALDHEKQNSIILPDSFDEHSIQIIGAGPVGVQVCLMLAKIGAKNISVHDPDPLEKTDAALGIHRAYDATRPKAQAAEEIVRNHTLRELNVLSENVISGTIVVQTSDNIATRRSAWEKIKANSAVGIYIDVQMDGEKGSIYTVNPNEEESVRVYEIALSLAEPKKSGIIYMTSIVSGLAVSAVKRYVRGEGVDSLYSIDTSTFFADQASLKKAIA